MPSNAEGKRFVVVAKNFETNELVVTFDAPDAPDLWRTSAEIDEINWINKPILEPREIYARVRYRDDLVKVLFTPLPDNRARVEFEKPQRAIAGGQVLAIHDSDPSVILGGGIYIDFKNSKK